MLSPRLPRPLQRRCEACRRTQDVPLGSLYHVVVPNKGGGTRRDAGYDCRYCGHQNPIPASALPPGLVTGLPSREILRKSKATAEPLVTTPPHAMPSSPKASPIPPMPDQPPPLQKQVEKAAAPPAISPVQPIWVRGSDARKSLWDAHARSEQDAAGLCTAFLRATDGKLQVVDARRRIPTDAIVDWLDQHGCELLVLGGTLAGAGSWKMIFHPLGGAASLLDEPG